MCKSFEELFILNYQKYEYKKKHIYKHKYDYKYNYKFKQIQIRKQKAAYQRPQMQVKIV